MHFQILHLHKRQRIHQEHQKYPHPDPKIQLLDKIVYVVSFVFPLSAIPQVLQIWVGKNVEGVSLLTWSLFLIFTIPLIMYAIVHKAKPLMIMWVLWMFVYVFVLVGLLKFG